MQQQYTDIREVLRQNNEECNRAVVRKNGWCGREKGGRTNQPGSSPSQVRHMQRGIAPARPARNGRIPRCLQNLASSLICMCHPTGGLAEGWVIQPNSLSASRRPGSTCCRETITPIGDVLGSGSGSRALKINIIAEDNPVRKASCRQGSETGQLRWK